MNVVLDFKVWKLAFYVYVNFSINPKNALEK